MDSSVNSHNSSIVPQIFNCSTSRTSSFIFMSWLIVYFLFLPIFISVIVIGYQQWRKQRSVSMATTHSDVFTFHMVAMEMMNIVGSCLHCWYLFSGTKSLGLMGKVVTIMTSFGQIFFHVLTCLERYLAVIHPITYQGLKQVGGVRIRNLSIGCVWLLSFILSTAESVVDSEKDLLLILGLFTLVVCAAFISFFSFTVLHVLIGPGPGEVGKDRKLRNKSKRRALNTMMLILGTLALKLTCYLSVTIGYMVIGLETDVACMMYVFSYWFNLPSSLVLPLLFLYRTRKTRM